MISNMNVALNKFSAKSLYMSIYQNLYNMSVKRCAFYLYLPFSANRFTDMLYKFWQIIILNDFTENLFNATFTIDKKRSTGIVQTP